MSLATSVATNPVTKLSQQRYAGTIEVTSSIDADVRDAAWEIRGGDTVTVEDWGPGEARTMRDLEVEYTPEAVTPGIEQDVSSDRMLARASLRGEQSRKSVIAVMQFPVQ
ncbi:MAG: hypothetical protein M3454_05925 [Actinomycetota bacterium]|nr:hypothetical protein [Actinomycetota bacterium]